MTDKYVDLVRAHPLKNKPVEYEGDGDTNYSWCTWNDPQKLEKRLKEQEIRRRIETIQTTVLLE